MHSFLLTLSALVVGSGVPIEGRVVDENDKPVAGAIVRVSTAKPRVGPQMVCPSCYTDCGKVALTDESGRFEIHHVSTRLFFGLATGAHGYQGKWLGDVDPMEPDLVIPIRRMQQIDPNQSLTGKVIDGGGEPVAGALVTVREVFYHSGRFGGPDETITPATVTDVDGNFALTVGTPVSRMSVRVTAPGFASTLDNTLQPGRPRQEIKVGEGAAIMGRLVIDGEPVKRLRLGLVQRERTLGNNVTPDEIVTSDDGMFRWDNLPPDRDYALYSFTGHDLQAALPVSYVHAPPHGKLADLGDVQATKPHSLVVEFVTVDGSAIPDRAYCYLSRSRAWHSDRQLIAPTTFSSVAFTGLAPEVTTLGVRIPGYRIATTEPFFQFEMNERLVIRSEEDQTITVHLQRREPR